MLGWLWSMGSQIAGHDWACTHIVFQTGHEGELGISKCLSCKEGCFLSLNLLRKEPSLFSGTASIHSHEHLMRQKDSSPCSVQLLSCVCSTPGLPVHCQLPEFIQTHVNWVSDAIQSSHPLSSPSAPALNLSQIQGHFQWTCSFHQVANVLEFMLQHQSFQWIFRTDFL